MIRKCIQVSNFLDKKFSLHIFLLQTLEEKIVAFIKNELKNVHKQQNYQEIFLIEEEDPDETKSSKDAFLTLTQQFLRRMKHGEVSSLLNSKSLLIFQCL